MRLPLFLFLSFPLAPPLARLSTRPRPRSKVKRVAVLVSKSDHCLYDLLIRHQAGELSCEVVCIVSNHPDLERVAQQFNVPFHHVPIEGGSASGGSADSAAKAAQEEKVEALLDSLQIDLIVLARYMQILSPDFCARNAARTINIHHSFLPAFEGGRPYHRAHERGVKIIGATAHYATAELDAGPIIDQDVTHISHRDSVTNMIRWGPTLCRCRCRCCCMCSGALKHAGRPVRACTVCVLSLSCAPA